MRTEPVTDAEIAQVEKVLRSLGGVGSLVTVGMQPTSRWLSGELWSLHVQVGAALSFGQGHDLASAAKDLHVVRKAG